MYPTAQENYENRIFPYVYLKTADQVPLSYVPKTRYNKLEEIVFIDEEITIKDGRGRTKKEQLFRKWNSSYTCLCKTGGDGDFEDIEDTIVFHDLGVVPVIPVFGKKPKGASTILPIKASKHNLAVKSVELLNLNSLIWHNLEDQSFSLPYYQSEYADSESMSNWTTYNALRIDLGATIRPDFASPDVGISENLQKAYERKVSQFDVEAEKRAGVRTVPSGTALRILFMPEQDTHDFFSSIAEHCERQIGELFKRYTGEDYEYTVYYSRALIPSEENAEIDVILNAYEKLDVPDSIRIDMILQILKKKLPYFSSEDVENWRQELILYFQETPPEMRKGGTLTARVTNENVTKTSINEVEDNE
jgi:hypothetical protein